ncbi:MAG TPA: DUF1990 domain-containing protein [Acidimicrobiales bacterium]|jgi:uncharacterized protein (UPF0548 family)
MVRPSSAVSLERHLVAARVAQPTYQSIGATLREERPQGFHHLSVATELGRGQAAFERAVLGLQTWRAHALPFVSVHPDGAPVEEGETVLVTVGLSLLSAAMPCRVVAVVEEPQRWGFAYGTLPGHIERGEEAFIVSCDGEGVVRFEVTAFSVPADAVGRLLGPVGRAAQGRVARGYLGALEKFVRAP